jgi:hypothetical protein
VGDTEEHGGIPTMTEQESVREERSGRYGNLWRITADIVQVARFNYPHAALWNSYYLAMWFKILGKVVRLIREPERKEHWIDIVGYAQLVVDDLEETLEGGTRGRGAT